MDSVNECSECIQGKETVLVEQAAYFKNLPTVLKQMTGIVEPVDGLAGKTRLPVILPEHMFSFPPKQFYDVVKIHEERLSVTHNAEC